MKKLIVTAITLLVAPAAYGAEQATIPAAGRPGAILNEADCDTVWKQAGGQKLTAEAAKPYVTNFDQVDVDKDGSIDYKEFKDGCKAGWVQKADASKK